MGLWKLIQKQKWLRIILGCLVLALLFCIPMLNQTFINGSDTSFHINRIISLSESIQNGDIYPRVFWNQNYQFGYGSPMFYSFFFLYIPALFHLWGMAILDTYRCLLYLIAFFSAFTMYMLSNKVSKNEPSAWISALLYLFNPFFYSNVYKRGAVGEELAYIFIPVVLLAAYELFYTRKKNNGCQLLMIGFSGLLLSHNITFLIMIGLFAVIALINIRKLVKKPRMLMIIFLAAGSTIALTAFFSFPMLEQLSQHAYRISNYFSSDNTMASAAMNLQNLFSLNVSNSVAFNASPGMILMVLSLLVFLPHPRKVSSYRRLLPLLGWLLVFMSSRFFPWNSIHIFDFMQFPTRFINPACACFAAAAGKEVWKLRIPTLNRRQIHLASGAFLSIIFTINLVQLYQDYGIFNNANTDADFSNDDKFYPDQKYWYDVMELSTPDYVPANTDISYRDYGRLITINSSDRLVEMDESEYGVLSFSTEQTIGNGYFQIPKTWYYGYTATAYRDGQKISMYETKMDSITGLVSFDIKDASDSPITVRVTYEPTTCQTVSAIVSWIALIGWIGMNLWSLIKKSILKRASMTEEGTLQE